MPPQHAHASEPGVTEPVVPVVPVADPRTALRVAVVGTGYVGLTTGACLAHLGHHVVCADIDPDKVALLERGEVPIVEDGLDEIVASARDAGRLSFQLGAAAAVTDAEIVLLCVPTPQRDDGSADLSYIEAAAAEVGPVLPSGAVVVNKSTVPVGTTKTVARALGRPDVHVVSNPEFLREGAAVHDFLHPARIVIGADHPSVAERVATLYSPLNADVFLTDPATAETIKYAANAFLATKISFINDVSRFCEAVGADVNDVADAIGQDPRIGRAFLDAGPGWGGSCFPKDSRALVSIAQQHGFDFPLMRAVIAANDVHQGRIVERVVRLAGRQPADRLDDVRVAVFGLTFKAGTDDLRESPSLVVVHGLLALGARVTAFDPTVAAGTAADGPLAGIAVGGSPDEAAADADLVVILTEWPEFAKLDWPLVAESMSGTTVFDARGIVDAAQVAKAGLVLRRIGVAD